MGKIDDSARLIIKIAHNKYNSSKRLSDIYKIPVSVVDQYLMGIDNGTLYGREVLRVEIARNQAGSEDFTAADGDKYKGGRWG